MTEQRLRLDQVGFDEGTATDGRGVVVDMALEAGELLLVELKSEDKGPPLADLAAGLVAPVRGDVWFAGVSWSQRGAEDHARARSRIGRVFEGQGWVSNLDLDENITLAQRHHTARDPAEIQAEAEAWARRLGLAGLPVTRPAWTPPRERSIGQWIRALLGEPLLLLLERPTRDVTREDVSALMDAVQERRAAGVAVMWLTSDERVLGQRALLDPLQHVVIHERRWERMQ